MLFTSFSFAVFLPIVFLLYWFATGGKQRPQNILLLVASYYFYACWDYRFLFLLVFSTLLDYFTGLRMHAAGKESTKRFWFWLSIGANLGFLGVFKYYNFFVESFVAGLAQLGIEAHIGTLQVILPVGISFYTFHGLSYVIDIYQKRITPERNFVDYGVFVSFFPLLVAGPIERATHLLPQIVRKREFQYAQAVDGMRQILWGIFKKVVIADACAWYVNMIFNGSDHHTGSTLLLGAVMFTFQIYGDFSGYSDIALGTAKLFGIDLIRNFNFPLFSQSMTEFWRKWHISLSSWIRDYLFTPVAMQLRYWGKWGIVCALFVSFTLNGLWHGANWTFIVWGILHGAVMAYEVLSLRLRKRLSQVGPAFVYTSASVFLTFSFWTFSLILFRAVDLHHAWDYVSGMFSSSLFSLPTENPKKLWIMLGLFFAVEWLGRNHQYGLQVCERIKQPFLRILLYYTVVALILAFGNFDDNQFIYFQF